MRSSPRAPLRGAAQATREKQEGCPYDCFRLDNCVASAKTKTPRRGEERTQRTYVSHTHAMRRGLYRYEQYSATCSPFVQACEFEEAAPPTMEQGPRFFLSLPTFFLFLSFRWWFYGFLILHARREEQLTGRVLLPFSSEILSTEKASNMPMIRGDKTAKDGQRIWKSIGND